MKEKILRNLEWLVGFILVVCVIYGSYNLSKKVAGENVQKKETDVVLDAGHGGDDPGKVGVNGAKEKEINLAVVQKIQKILEEEGISVILTRTKDARLDKNGQEYSKTEDMKTRVQVMNEAKPKLVVSVHQNSYPSEDVKGGQVFYFTHSAESQKYAEIMQEAIRTVDPSNHRQMKENETYYLLKKTEVPALIVECGFLSNWEEAEKLIQDSYQEEMAKAIAEGIKSCLESTSQN